MKTLDSPNARERHGRRPRPGVPGRPDRAAQRDAALARWETEGGAGPNRAGRDETSDAGQAVLLPPTHAEWSHLRVRVIALENLLLSLLVDASAPQLDLAHGMAVYISPRPGFTKHRMTVHAAVQMVRLLRRAGHFRDLSPP